LPSYRLPGYNQARNKSTILNLIPKNIGTKIASAALFLHRNFYHMEYQKKNKGLAWLIFFLSFAALIFAIYSHWPWLTLILPFMATSFVWAMDIM